MEIKEHNPPIFQFPPGFRFHPTDEELIVYYLENKATSRPLPASIIAEIDLYKYNPWELPKKALFGEDEWYFFSPRDRKYPNGERPNRAAGEGYWKATGTDKPILSSSGSKLGVKKALVFYTGRPPRGLKTDWMMNEYRLDDNIIKPSRSKRSMRLDDWVLCRIRVKSSTPTRACEIQDTNKAELVSYSTKIEEVRPTPTYTDNNADMIRDCLNKDCKLLASILAGEGLPPIEVVSTPSCQRSINSNSFTSVFEDGTSYRVNAPLILSSLDTNYFNPPYSKKQKSDNRDQDLQFSKALPNNDINYYGQCHEGIYTNPSDPFTDFQEVHESPFSGKY